MGHHTEPLPCPPPLRMTLATTESQWALFKAGWNYHQSALTGQSNAFAAGFRSATGMVVVVWIGMALASIRVVKLIAAAPLLFQLFMGFAVVSVVWFALGIRYARRQLRQAERMH